MQPWTTTRKEKTTPFGVNLMRSQVLYRAAQDEQQHVDVDRLTNPTFLLENWCPFLFISFRRKEQGQVRPLHKEGRRGQLSASMPQKAITTHEYMQPK